MEVESVPGIAVPYCTRPVGQPTRSLKKPERTRTQFKCADQADQRGAASGKEGPSLCNESHGSSTHECRQPPISFTRTTWGRRELAFDEQMRWLSRRVTKNIGASSRSVLLHRLGRSNRLSRHLLPAISPPSLPRPALPDKLSGFPVLSARISYFPSFGLLEIGSGTVQEISQEILKVPVRGHP